MSASSLLDSLISSLLQFMFCSSHLSSLSVVLPLTSEGSVLESSQDFLCALCRVCQHGFEGNAGSETTVRGQFGHTVQEERGDESVIVGMFTGWRERGRRGRRKKEGREKEERGREGYNKL